MKIETFSTLLLIIQLCYGDETNENVSLANNTSNSKTPGAADVTAEEFVYIVGVIVLYGPTQGITYGQKSCTGTLIREDLVMTLATCLIYDKQFDPDPDTVRVFVRPSGRILRAFKIYINPNFYNEDQYISNTNDIGVIIVEPTEQTYFPKLPDSLNSFNSIRHSCIMGGYGNQKDPDADIFTYFKAYNINKTNAEEFTGRGCFGESVVCVHFAEIMPCQADIGTPLICNGVVFALYMPWNWDQYMTSTCSDLYLTVFSPVFHFREWVAQIVDEPTSKLAWLNNPWYVLLLCCVVFLFMGGIYYTLVEILQRSFDPADGLMTMMPLESDEDMDEDSWFDSQWTR